MVAAATSVNSFQSSARLVPSTSKVDKKTEVRAPIPPSQLVADVSSRQRDQVRTVPFAAPRQLQSSSPPPYCEAGTLCQVPSPRPTLQPAPYYYSSQLTPSQIAAAADNTRRLKASAIFMGLFLVCLIIYLPYYHYTRKLRQERELSEAVQQLEEQQQHGTIPTSSEPTAQLSESDRRIQMENKLKPILPDDVIMKTDDLSCCSICLNDFKSDHHISGSLNPDCRHFFHTECILQAFLHQRRVKLEYECPVCRRDFFMDQEEVACSCVQQPNEVAS